MKIEDVKALAEVLKKYDLSAVETGQGTSRIRVERHLGAEAKIIAAPALDEARAPEAASVCDADTIQVKSPMVGVFYAAPSPDSEPFVSMGKKVAKGDVLCIVEAMKLMNEITADADGEIVDICVANGQVVEFGQELFRLRRCDNG
jgi:acetyl-CoA carboxylase biotin carboxyl carrier protein